MTSFPLEAHQNSITLALKARQAFARGQHLRGVDADESQEAFADAWDYAFEAGGVCGKHDLPCPFALTEVPALLTAFVDGGGEPNDEHELDERLDEASEDLAKAA